MSPTMVKAVVAAVAAAVALGAASGAAPAASRVFRLPLDPGGRYPLFWSLDYPGRRVHLEVHVPGLLYTSWFAVGFSDYGKFTDADFCLLWADTRGTVHLQDSWSDDKGLLWRDGHQDCERPRFTVTGNVTKFSFVRKFDTCDEHDYCIEEGTTHIVWAKGDGVWEDMEGRSVWAGEKGMQRVELLKNLEAPVRVEAEEAVGVTVTADRVRVPPIETLYWCHVTALPTTLIKPHHIVKFESVITKGNEGLVHHMELFHCEADRGREVPLYRGRAIHPTDRMQLKFVKVLAAWAMGATAFYYPEVAGLPVGGTNFNLHVMLEVHYNNPEREQAVPEGGVTIFGSQLHTHLSGVRVVTRHVGAGGEELPELSRDNHYSTHFQEIRLLKRQVTLLPGETLMTTCTYNTEDRPNVTLGGFAISDEMCVNYIYYYPKIDLEVCKSSISDRPLKDYFDTMKTLEGQKTGSGLPISEAYGSIEWTPLRTRVLENLYRVSPVYMQCNDSAGARFPGDWGRMPLPQVLRPLPPPARNCPNQQYRY